MFCGGKLLWDEDPVDPVRKRFWRGSRVESMGRDSFLFSLSAATCQVRAESAMLGAREGVGGGGMARGEKMESMSGIWV